MEEDIKSFVDLLTEFVSFKSISTDSKYKDEINKLANFLVDIFSRNSFNSHLIHYKDTNPIVYSEYVHDSSLKTVLLYGHYDVQPADESDGWFQDPFKLLIKDSKLYGRGVADNKGQFAVYMYSIFKLIKQGKLSYNVKFLIEGNEETGSSNLKRIIEENKNLLKCDFVLFSDGELTMKHPTIDIGFRGIANVILQIKTSSKDNHSGLYGGAIPNASLVLSSILSKMYDDNFNLLLPDLDNSLDVVDKNVLEEINKIPFDENIFFFNTGSKIRLNNSFNFYSQIGFLTSAEITTLKSGYLGDGFRNAIPGYAEAKINFRISPYHNVKDVIDKFKNFVNSNIPWYAEANVIVDEYVDPINLNINSFYLQKVKEFAGKVYKKNVFIKPCGAIVPVSGIFKDVLNIDVVSIGFANEDCNMHGINENFDLDMIVYSLKFAYSFFANFFIE